MPRALLAGTPASPGSLVAVGTCAGVVFGFDVLYVLALDAALDPPYLAWTAALTVVAAALAAAAGALVRRPEAALVVWAAALGAFGLQRSGAQAATTALGLALLTGLALWGDRRTRRRRAASGVLLGAAFCLATTVWPRAMRALAPALLSDIGWLQPVLGFALALAAVVGYERARAFLPRAPSATALAGIVLLSALVSVSLSIRQTRPTWEDRANAIATASGERADRAPHVILLVLDTVRADHLSIYGYERDTTPALRRFLAANPRATVVPMAFAPSNWTVPAHASLLTGLIPSDHGAHSGRADDIAVSPIARASLSAPVTLAEVVRSRGYATAAIVANPTVLRIRGLERGFDRFFQPPAVRPLTTIGEGLRRALSPGVRAAALGVTPSAERVNQEVLRFLAECGQQPCFVLANYMEAHEPYHARPPHAGSFSKSSDPGGPRDSRVLFDDAERQLAIDRYDEEILDLDSELGALLEELDAQDLARRSWIFITSDHGEAFVEHGDAGHGSSLYNTQVRIPLVIAPPKDVALPEPPAMADLLDVAATIAAVAGAEPLGVGRDLTQSNPRARTLRIEFFGELWSNVERFGPLSQEPSRAVVREGMKLIEHAGRRELYDLSDDPDERENLARSEAALVHSLAEALPPLSLESATPGADEPKALSADEEATLRALGYLQ